MSKFVVISYHPNRHPGVVWSKPKELDKEDQEYIRRTGQRPEINTPKPDLFKMIYGHGDNIILGREHQPFFINAHITKDEWDLIEAEAKRTNRLHFLENIIASTVSNGAEAKKLAYRGYNDYSLRVNGGMLAGGIQTKTGIKADEVTPVINAPKHEIEELKAKQIPQDVRQKAKEEMAQLNDEDIIF